MPEPLFADLLVLDCASYVAGPAAATIMADFGARVIKIEPPGDGDAYRKLITLPGAPVAERDYFWVLDNRTKEGLALDLKQEFRARGAGHALGARRCLRHQLSRTHSREASAARRRRMPRNDRVIYASLTPYGEEGPEKDRKGFDATAWWARSA